MLRGPARFSLASAFPAVAVAVAVALALALAFACGGCKTVDPYERETLARPDMKLDGNPDLAASEDHATEVREGTSGGFGGGGGGCGCN